MNLFPRNWLIGPDLPDKPLCKACYSRPFIHQIYCGDVGLLGVCGPCLLAIEQRKAKPELLWMESQYRAPSAKEDR
jgi:hypothetical protein